MVIPEQDSNRGAEVGESEKRKRGRPRLLAPEFERSERKRMPYRSARSLHNLNYESRAVVVLGLSPSNPEDFRYRWLADYSRIQLDESARRYYKKSILMELGRMKDDAQLMRAADSICLLKPTTQDAIQLIRSWRLGRRSLPKTLTSVLRDAIESYIRVNPSVDSSEICNALGELEIEYLQAVLAE